MKVLGQKVALKILAGMYKEQKLHHAYLLYGDDGIGKFESALNFAKAIFCKEGGGKYCGKCEACRRISEYRYPELITLSTGAKHLNAKFYYERLCAHPAAHLLAEFKSNARNILSRVEQGILPPYETYPASLPKEYMLGQKKESNRYNSIEVHYLALSKTLNRIDKDNYLKLEDIFAQEWKNALEYAKSHGNRKLGKKNETQNFFDSLYKVYYNISHSTLPIAAIRKVISKTEMKPATSKGRLFIIEGLELMEASCANIFLRTLEEPPENNIFILTCSDIDNVRKDVIGPLSSRMMKIEFSALSPPDLEKLYCAGFGFTKGEGHELALRSSGSPGKGISMYLNDKSGGGSGGVYENLKGFFKSLKSGSGLVEFYTRLADTDIEAAAVLSPVIQSLRCAFLKKQGIDSHEGARIQEIEQALLDISAENLIILSEGLDTLIKDSKRKSVKKKLLLLKAFSDIITLYNKQMK